MKDIYIWSFDMGNFSVDITDVLDTKLQALSEHKSQFGDNPDFLRYIRERWRNDDGRHLEQFRHIALIR